MPARPSTLVFDVNETLLDVRALEPVFARLFGDAGVLREWFAQAVLYSQTATLAGRYVPFGAIGLGALRMVADVRGVKLAEGDLDDFRKAARSLPAHPDAAPALDRLAAAGFRLVTLTNSSPDAQAESLENAGLADRFERTFSVGEVERFKPAPEVYRHVEGALGVAPAGLALVACHAWDTLGAQAAGWSGVFVARPGNAPFPADGLPQPDVVAPDLGAAADRMVERWRPSGPGPIDPGPGGGSA